MEIERAKAVVQVADSITNTAKVEVEMMKVTGSTAGTGFIPQLQIGNRPQQPRLVDPTNPGAQVGRVK
jgi:hypothetical protein